MFPQFWKYIFGVDELSEPKIEKLNYDIAFGTNIITAEKFNDWFMNEYEGYGGKGNAKGIFLRLDKLSRSMITEYLDYNDIKYTDLNAIAFEDYIYNNWKSLK